ncbi:concanavalin A-like lectin/glucanase domain-containing protein [Massariosphaeria phaeospora]|uniref:Concanavalin A-like lectin/glucanase domain-containing protein n=1 Tax=Massariosphaeria phaeospora TaxID=100035 RepID=A0A7C8ICR1_9PLEO|nr:concanavalin A-like lectin/glucanase domain-containing protein [Massariosphaeria phaeospora]
MMISTLPPLGSVLLHLAFFLQPASSDYTSTNSSNLHDGLQNCGCYVVDTGADSKSPEYFQFHRFFDFRNLAGGPGQYVQAPPLVNDTQDAGDEPLWTPNVLGSDAWSADWGIQNWGKNATEEFPVKMVNSPANVYIQQNDDEKNAFSWLTLRTTRLDEFQSAAEIESLQKNLNHVSMRMKARVVGAKGAVAGFFTFFDDDNESDIEILTDDAKDVIRYTNQPALDGDGNEVAEASISANKLPAWDDWQTHRIDWLPKNSYWYLNDKQVATNTYSVPRTPSFLVMNMWSDGGEWSGNMSVGDSAEFQIQWIELLFNTSGPVEGPPQPNDVKKRSMDLLEKREEKGCEIVCKVDGVKAVGTPEIVGLASGLSVSWALLVAVGMVSTFVSL